MPYSVIIAYPKAAEATFDKEYYLTSHMPLVESRWKELGLLRWELVEFDGQDDQAGTGFARANTLVFKDQAAYAAASQGSVGEEIFGDVPNFSNRQPVILAGWVVGSG